MSFYLEQIIKRQQEHTISMAKELDRLLKENEYFKTENKKLKSENYKDEELKSLKKEVEAYKEALSHSFCIWNKEDVDDWIKIHDKKHKTDKSRKYTHHYSYIFTPSPLGTIVQ